jgi:hypothetical protein
MATILSKAKRREIQKAIEHALNVFERVTDFQVTRDGNLEIDLGVIKYKNVVDSASMQALLANLQELGVVPLCVKTLWAGVDPKTKHFIVWCAV